MSFSLVAHTSAQAQAGPTTGAIDTTGADLLVVHAIQYVGGAPGVLTDSKSNTWTQLTVKSSGEPQASLFYCKNPTVGSGHTFNYTNGNVYATIEVSAWSGADLTAPFDVENGSTSGSGTATTTQPGSVTPNEAGSLIITGVSPSVQGTISFATAQGFTILDNDPGLVSTYEGGAVAYLIQGAAAAVNPTWQWVGTSVNVSVIAAFKPAASNNSAAPGVGTMAFTGYAPTVTQTTGTAIAPGVGTLTITGYAPTVSQSGTGTITTPALKNNTATVQGSLTGLVAHVMNASGTIIVTKTGQTTSAGGVMTITDALIVASTTYHVAIVNPSTGAVGITNLITAT